MKTRYNPQPWQAPPADPHPGLGNHDIAADITTGGTPHDLPGIGFGVLQSRLAAEAWSRLDHYHPITRFDQAQSGDAAGRSAADDDRVPLALLG
jgi:hypothetical protein